MMDNERSGARTQFIIKEEEPEELDPEEAKQREIDENNRYFLGYYKWYWGHYGFFKSIKDFFGKRILYGCIYSIFNSIGAAIGAFFFKRLVLMETGLKPYLT